MRESANPQDTTHAIDPVASARWLQHIPRAPDWLADTVAQRMAERLTWLCMQPKHWLDWHPNLGGRVGHQLVRQRYPGATTWIHGPHARTMRTRLWQGMGWTKAWQLWRRAQPWPGQPAVDLLWANMVAHHVANPDALLSAWHAAMVEHGVLLFSALGPSSCQGLDAVSHAMGEPPPHHPYIDMHDWGDALLRAGFAEPVMDAQRLTLTYQSLDKLVADLRAAGRNLHPGRHPHCKGRAWFARWQQALAQHLPRSAQGHWQLDVEIIYGHAWRAKPRASKGQAQPVQVSGRLGEKLGNQAPAGKLR